ncbi:hypothetical protein IPG41_02320 [Candidatus Peregrinibacteria bacterium]|nr:MAG: hypothetical protein IPG41_02320 [Candidatus Peregrinibacteria bacterium]
MKQPSHLGRVFPKETVYFYGFPFGWDSHFLNESSPEDEECVAGRPMVCAGPGVKVVVYSNSVKNGVYETLTGNFGVPLVSPNQQLILPQALDSVRDPSRRNEILIQALARYAPDGRLVMAQPFLDPRLANKYMVKPEVTVHLNDKKNLEELVPSEYRIREMARYENGSAFAQAAPHRFEYPCVIKLTSSGGVMA